MNRNAESRFALAPNVKIPRSIQDRPFDHKTTFDVGRLIPMYFEEVLPGQTTRLITNSVVRMQPMATCPMDDLYLDTYFFFVPNRLVWSHWKEFCGENTNAPWVQTTEYTIPQLSITGGSNGTKILSGSLLDYFGIPMNTISENDTLTFSALPFRAYALIVREFFQDQNLETPVNVILSDSTYGAVGTSQTTGTYLDNNYVTLLSRGGNPYIVNKYHDYFTSCTPGPTKSVSDILAFPDLPVIYTSDELTSDQIDQYYPDGFPTYITMARGADLSTQEYGVPAYIPNNGTDPVAGLPISAYAMSSVTINDLRQAFMVQRLLERDLYGTRYREQLKAHFGVTSPDASMQVPQYLGGKRQSLRISQILQTSETGSTPQGNVAGYSLTSDTNFDFEQSFTEHGMIIGLACVRYKNSYQNGLNRYWSKKTRYDFYYPELAGLGNQAIYKKELFADGSSTDDEVFGYQEAWADYRYRPDMITGEMRSTSQVSLDSWHFGDDYDSAPTLSRDWLKADLQNVDRALAVQSNTADQLWADFFFQERVTLPMPLYSIPGLGEHF